MSISDLHPRPGPAAVLTRMVDELRDLDATWWTNQTDEDLVEVVEQLARLRAVAAAVEAGAVAEADARDLGKTKLAYGSTGDWLTHLGGLRKGEGRRLVTRAHALAGPLTATRAAMAAGTVSPEQADVIAKAIDLLPSGQAVRARGEQTCWTMRGASMPPTWPGPGDTWSTWSTPTPRTGSWSGSWTGRNAPPTTPDISPSWVTGPAGSGSRDAGPPRTAPSSRPPCCR
jgi:hypothetical protein